MTTKARFEIVAVERDHVMIRDTGHAQGYMTVTNDAENVVAELLNAMVLRPGMRLEYYDSDGRLDEITFNDDGFTGFKPLTQKAAHV